MESESVHLPPEILDAIFHILAEDPRGPDIEALKACSLVSTEIANICEPHLYSCFYISQQSRNVDKTQVRALPDRYDLSCQISIDCFESIAERKPGIGRLIKRLGIIMVVRRKVVMGGNSEGVVRDHRGNDPWLQLHRAPNPWLKRVLEVLRRLKPERIQWFKIWGSELCDVKLTSNLVLREIILYVVTISTKSLSTLLVHGMENFPVAEVFCLPRKLAIRNIQSSYSSWNLDLVLPADAYGHPGMWVDMYMNKNPIPVILDSLVMREQDELVHQIIMNQQMGPFKLVDLSRLKRLCCTAMDNVRRLESILIHCKKLEEVAIDYIYNGRTWPWGGMMLDSPTYQDPLWDTLATNQKTLKHLVLMTTRNKFPNWRYAFQGLTVAFKIPNGICFQELSFMFLQINIGENPDSVELSAEEENHLVTVVRVLCDREKFPKLQKIGVAGSLRSILRGGDMRNISTTRWWIHVSKVFAENLEKYGGIEVVFRAPFTNNTFEYFTG